MKSLDLVRTHPNSGTMISLVTPSCAPWSETLPIWKSGRQDDKQCSLRTTYSPSCCFLASQHRDELCTSTCRLRISRTEKLGVHPCESRRSRFGAPVRLLRIFATPSFQPPSVISSVLVTNARSHSLNAASVLQVQHLVHSPLPAGRPPSGSQCRSQRLRRQPRRRESIRFMTGRCRWSRWPGRDGANVEIAGYYVGYEAST